MKSFKQASIIAFIIGSLFLGYNIYRLFSLDPIFEENNLPSLLISFTSISMSAYVFVMLKELLNTQFKNKTTDKLLIWVIRLEIIVGIVALFSIVSMLALYFQGVDLLMESPSSFFSGILSVFMNYVLLFVASFVLSIVFILLGDKLKNIKAEGSLFFVIGVSLMTYGILTILTTIFIIDNDFIAPIVKYLTIILIGVTFRKYGARKEKALIENEIEQDNYEFVDLIKEEITFEKEVKEAKANSIEQSDKDDLLDKEDPSRFMPK